MPICQRCGNQEPEGKIACSKCGQAFPKDQIASKSGRVRPLMLILVAVVTVVVLAGASKIILPVFPSGSTSPHQITVTSYEISGDGSDITPGPDGNLWFTENNRIGRMTPGGKSTEFALPTANSDPLGITAGPDGNLWFTELEANRIGRITPAGQITEYSLPTDVGSPKGITAGPDGNLWFTEGSGQIGKITPAGQISEYPLPIPQSLPYHIVSGPDGNLWFTEFGNDAIGKITPTGQITEYPFPTPGIEPIAITTGRNGNLWFTEQTVRADGVISGGRIGQITPDGQITDFSLPSTSATLGSLSFGEAITSGPDGNLWFVNGVQAAHEQSIVEKITPGGSVTFPIPKTQNYHLLYTQRYILVSADGITVGPDKNLWFIGSTSPKGKSAMNGIIMRLTL